MLTFRFNKSLGLLDVNLFLNFPILSTASISICIAFIHSASFIACEKLVGSSTPMRYNSASSISIGSVKSYNLLRGLYFSGLSTISDSCSVTLDSCSLLLPAVSWPLASVWVLQLLYVVSLSSKYLTNTEKLPVCIEDNSSVSPQFHDFYSSNMTSLLT